MVLRTGIKRAAESLASRLGYAIVPHWQMDSLPLARHLREALHLHHIDCVFDVGANKGQFGRFLRDQVGYTGKIMSFEPVAATFAALREQAKGDPHWQAFPIALGDSAGTATINVTHADTFSSLLAPRPVADFAASSAVISTQECNVDRLDEWMARQGIKYRRCFLKLDTQGYDLNVLRGAAGILDRIPLLQTELSFVPLYEGMPTFREMIDYAETLGYRVSNMFRVSAVNGAAVEFDCVLSKIRCRDRRSVQP